MITLTTQRRMNHPNTRFELASSHDGYIGALYGTCKVFKTDHSPLPLRYHIRVSDDNATSITTAMLHVDRIVHDKS